MTGELPFDAEPPFDRPIRAVVSDIDGTLTTPTAASLWRAPPP